MDPDACWGMICAYLSNRRAMSEAERDGLGEACINLRFWLANDGFMPSNVGLFDKQALIRVLRAVELYAKKF